MDNKKIDNFDKFMNLIFSFVIGFVFGTLFVAISLKVSGITIKESKVIHSIPLLIDDHVYTCKKINIKK